MHTKVMLWVFLMVSLPLNAVTDRTAVVCVDVVIDAVVVIVT